MKRLFVAVLATLFLFSGGLGEGVAKSTFSGGGSSKSSSSGGGSRSSGPSSPSGSSGSSGGRTYGNSAGGGYSAPSAPSTPKGPSFSGGAPASPPPSAGPGVGRPDAQSYGNSAGAGSAAGRSAPGASAYGKSAGSASSSGGQKSGGFTGGPPPKAASKSALEDYKSRFAKPAAAPAADSAASRAYRSGSSGRDPYVARDDFYGRQRWSPPPYMYQSSPSFGIFDAMMLWFMLDHLTEPSYARMAYNMSDDPAFRQWREEAGRLSADNAELRQKVEQMDARLKEFEGQGVKKEPGVVPEGIDPAVVVAPEAAAGAASSGGAWRWLLAAVVLGASLVFMTRMVRRRA